MTNGKPVRKIVFVVLGAAVVLCVTGLVLFFLISNMHKNNLRNDIISECPFSISGDAGWKMYPKTNQAGLIAEVSEHDGQVDRMILVLDKSADKYSSAGNIRSIVLWHDYFRIICSGGGENWRDLEEKNVYETDDFIYLRAQYDSSQTLTRIEIGTGPSDSFSSGYGEGVSFNFSDSFKVTYYIYGGTVITMTQEYNEKSGWSAVENYEGERLAYD